MATSFITTKYGTKINVAGLNPDQIAKVKSVAEDNGARGSAGAALADTFRAQGASQAPSSIAAAAQKTALSPTTTNQGVKPNPAQPQQQVQAQGTGFVLGTDLATLQSQLAHAQEEVQHAQSKGRVSQGWNDRVSKIQAAIQKMQPSAGTPGAPAANPGVPQQPTTVGQINTTGAPALPGGQDVTQLAQQAQQANYGFITQNYAQQKQNEVNAARARLESQGIPEDPNPNSLWGRTMQQIDQKYQQMDQSAHEQAISLGNQTLTATTDVQKTAWDSFFNAAQAMTDEQLKAQGLTDDMIKAVRANATQISAAKIAAAASNKNAATSAGAEIGASTIGAYASMANANTYANANTQNTPAP